MAPNASQQLRFILVGFVPDRGFRLFTFEGLENSQGVAAGQTRTEFTVRTDLSLIRGYGIRVQELPLLCRELLEQRADSETTRHLTYTEEDMRLHQAHSTAQQAAMRKRPTYKPPAAKNTGNTWRTTAPLRVGSYT